MKPPPSATIDWSSSILVKAWKKIEQRVGLIIAGSLKGKHGEKCYTFQYGLFRNFKLSSIRFYSSKTKTQKYEITLRHVFKVITVKAKLTIRQKIRAKLINVHEMLANSLSQ